MRARTRRLANASAAVGFLAAAIAALPSLDWCPLTEWTAVACELRAEASAASASPVAAVACKGDHGCPRVAAEDDASETCAGPLCDPEPDPLSAGDRLWCIQPPVTALGAKADPLPSPGPSPSFALLLSPLRLAPPAVVALSRASPRPRPLLLRGAHAPPQPRAPPIA